MGILKSLSAVLDPCYRAASEVFTRDFSVSSICDKWPLLVIVWLVVFQRMDRGWKEDGSGRLFYLSVKTQFWVLLSSLLLSFFMFLPWIAGDWGLSFIFLLSGMAVVLIVPLVMVFSLCVGLRGGLSPQGKRMFYLQVAAVLMLGAVFCVRKMADPREDACRMLCLRQFKSVGLSLTQYSMDNDGFFPNKDGVEGLLLLVKNKYLDEEWKLVCPSTMKGSGSVGKLSGKDVSYEYRGGFKNEPGAGRRPLMWDKSGNHNYYGNVLYTDGHVEGFSGADWMKKAGIPENEAGK